VEESKLQHQKQLQQGKRLVEEILRGLATDMVLHLDDVQWDEDFDVRLYTNCFSPRLKAVASATKGRDPLIP